MSYRLFAVVSVAVLALQGCAQPKPQSALEVDYLNEGIAKTCTFTPIQPMPGATVESTITMTNDGWCAYRGSVKSGQAFDLGLVKQRPTHGELLIRKWNAKRGSNTRLRRAMLDRTSSPLRCARPMGRPMPL